MSGQGSRTVRERTLKPASMSPAVTSSRVQEVEVEVDIDAPPVVEVDYIARPPPHVPSATGRSVIDPTSKRSMVYRSATAS
jgi:hypothetical protein